MATIVHQIGALSVSVKHLWQKTPTSPYYYRRRVPKDIAQALGQTWSVMSLRTSDITLAAKLIARQASLDDALWNKHVTVLHLKATVRKL